jgi:hypothetical protein
VAPAPVSVPHRHPWLLLTAAALAGAALASVGWSLRADRMPPASTELVHLFQPIGDPDTLRNAIAMSPDGTRVAYATPEGLYIRRLAEPDAWLVPASSGASAVTFSPDGRSVVFIDIDDQVIKRVDGESGVPRNVCTLCGRVSAMHWYDEDWIAYSQQPGDIMRVPASGGSPAPLVKIDASLHAYGPHVLPGGRAVVFTQAPTSGNFLDDATLMLQPVPSGDRVELVRGASDGRFHASTRHLLYAMGTTLFAAPFDAETGRLEAARSVVHGVQRSQDGVTGAAHYGVSSTGVLVYVPVPAEDVSTVQVFLIAPGGEARPLPMPPGLYDAPRLSPDGRHLAFVTRTARGSDIWIYDMAGSSAPRQLTTGGRQHYPVWSDDGRWIVFQSDEGDRARLVRKRANGTGPTEPLTNPDSGVTHLPEAWRPRTDEFAYSERRGSEVTLWIYAMSTRTATRFDERLVAAGAFNAAFSHDGRLIAYTKRPLADPAGRTPPEATRVFVQPVPRTGDEFPVTGDLPHHPLWSRTRLQLLYLPAGGRLLSVDISWPALTFSAPVPVPGAFRSNTSGVSPRRHDIGPDGELVATLPPSFRTDERNVNAVVILNWGEWLRQQAP